MPSIGVYKDALGAYGQSLASYMKSHSKDANDDSGVKLNLEVQKGIGAYTHASDTYQTN